VSCLFIAIFFYKLLGCNKNLPQNHLNFMCAFLRSGGFVNSIFVPETSKGSKAERCCLQNQTSSLYLKRGLNFGNQLVQQQSMNVTFYRSASATLMLAQSIKPLFTTSSIFCELIDGKKSFLCCVFYQQVLIHV
jgi:hypothetical protein